MRHTLPCSVLLFLWQERFSSFLQQFFQQSFALLNEHARHLVAFGIGIGNGAQGVAIQGEQLRAGQTQQNGRVRDQDKLRVGLLIGRISIHAPLAGCDQAA